MENGVHWDKLTTHSRKRASKYKGLYKSGDKWVARIWVNKKFMYLGRFETDYKAYLARQKAIKTYSNVHSE